MGFKDLDGKEISEDELHELLGEYWEDDALEWIISIIKKSYDGDYKAWKEDFFKNHALCEGFHDIEWWTPKKDLVEIDGLNYCPSCIDYLHEVEKKE